MGNDPPNVVATSCEAPCDRRSYHDRPTERTAARELTAAAGFACCIAWLGDVSRPMLKTPSFRDRNHVLDHSLLTSTELLEVGSP